MKGRFLIWVLLPIACLLTGTTSCEQGCEEQQATVLILPSDGNSDVTLADLGYDSIKIVERGTYLQEFVGILQPYLPIGMEDTSATFIFTRGPVKDTLQVTYMSKVIYRESCDNVGFRVDNFQVVKNTLPFSAVTLFPENSEPPSQLNGSPWEICRVEVSL